MKFYRARGFAFPGSPGSAPPCWPTTSSTSSPTSAPRSSPARVFALIARASTATPGSLLAMVVSLFETGYLAATRPLFRSFPRPALTGQAWPLRYMARCAMAPDHGPDRRPTWTFRSRPGSPATTGPSRNCAGVRHRAQGQERSPPAASALGRGGPYQWTTAREATATTEHGYGPTAPGHEAPAGGRPLLIRGPDAAGWSTPARRVHHQGSQGRLPGCHLGILGFGIVIQRSPAGSCGTQSRGEAHQLRPPRLLRRQLLAKHLITGDSLALHPSSIIRLHRRHHHPECSI